MRGFKSSWRQTATLVRKNFLIVVVRKWKSTLFRALLLPIVFLVLILNIKNFTKIPNRYGIGEIRRIKSLAGSLNNGKPLVTVRLPGLGPDFPPIYEKIIGSLKPNAIVELEREDQITAACPVDFHGNSPCYAVVIFRDSPLSGRPGATWNYTIRTDPSYIVSPKFDPFDDNTGLDNLYLPLQSAVENAMANLTSSPEIQAFTYSTPQQIDDTERENFLILALYILTFVFYFIMVPLSQHIAGTISSERESGMSQLIDAMGGGVAWQRTLSCILFFDMLYIPSLIIFGALFFALLLPNQSAAAIIFWQILSGWATASASSFGAAFFKRSAFAATFVPLVSFLLAVIAAYTDNNQKPNPPGLEIALSFIFPSANFVYMLALFARATINRAPLDFSRPLDLDSAAARPFNWAHTISPGILWAFMIIQIIVYPLLAILVESILYGNNRHRRTFDVGENSPFAIRTDALQKLYKPSWFKKIFCCSRKKDVKAVDGLDIASRKHQIFCLLGPNGSGKTTTLDMLAGFQKPTGGSISINASQTQIGICPQRNVMWDDLTVSEHLAIWNALKGNTEDKASMEDLIRRCDLGAKMNSLAGGLSGGMKRKLQMACMLIGGSTVCLMDEVTSGLDPISRRCLWNLILSERSKRTIILTTHFLDECEVLSDHVVIVTLGKLKCQGTPAQLKNQYGNGYRVHIPKTEDVSDIRNITEHNDGYTCQVPDSTSAAQLIATFKGSSDSDVYVTGPTIEEVFLKVSEEPHALIGETPEDFRFDELDKYSSTANTPARLSMWAIYTTQIRALLLKKIFLLRANWWMYFFVLAIPIIAIPQLKPFLKGYITPDCDNILFFDSTDSPMSTPSVRAVGPPSFSQTLTEMFDLDFINSTNSESFIVDSKEKLLALVHRNGTLGYGGALWSSQNENPFIAYSVEYGPSTATDLLNTINQARSGVEMRGYLSSLTSYRPMDAGASFIYIAIFCLIHALYPAFFALYPAYERTSKVRALEYSNGIRPFPRLFSYLLFDFFFILIIAVVCTVLIAPTAPWFGIGYVGFVQILFGIAATLIAYLVSNVTKSQGSAFFLTFIVMVVMFVLSFISLNETQGKDDNHFALDGTTYGLGLIFPIQNLLRSMAVSLNSYIILCRSNGKVENPGSIHAYGGPILLLVIQIIGLFSLLLWMEGGSFSLLTKLSRRKPKKRISGSSAVELVGMGMNHEREKHIGSVSGRKDVDKEAVRVSTQETDLLRVLHASKTFGSQVAVDDVSFGLQKGEILALLGPNGAGKTTTINMIRAEETLSSGRILLEGIDVQTNKINAQQRLGVCPQFDALDKLTVKQHLHFYALAKGLPSIATEIKTVMARVGLTAHASKPADKLSGGNQRKLSLAIALIGNPPVLLLDEPSTAMDAASKRVFWRILERAVAPGRSVLLTTHSMEEADALATRAAILAGRLLAVGTTESLRREHADEYRVHMVLKTAPLSEEREMRGVAAWVLGEFPDAVPEGEHLGGQVRFTVQGGPGVTRRLIESLEGNKEGLGIECYSISAATMESVFLKVVQGWEEESGRVLGDGEEGVKRKGWWRYIRR